ncbi:hypothetical protein [Spirillospora sp. NPDC047279]|uniref:hypothetical protein n=1 Tax=Spirillospora sp. NPDC047279 TaxID=3155478 RepID=UPI00340D1251
MKRRVLALVGVLVVTAAGCQPNGSDLTQVEASRVRVGYPKQWQRADKDGHITANKTEGGRTVAQLTVMERVIKATTADLAVSAMQVGRVTQPGYRRGESSELDVKGAKDARRLNYTYTSSEGGTPRPGVGTDVIALVERDVYVVRITGLKDKVAQSEIDAIVESIELKEG